MAGEEALETRVIWEIADKTVNKMHRCSLASGKVAVTGCSLKMDLCTEHAGHRKGFGMQCRLGHPKEVAPSVKLPGPSASKTTGRPQQLGFCWPRPFIRTDQLLH